MLPDKDEPSPEYFYLDGDFNNSAFSLSQVHLSLFPGPLQKAKVNLLLSESKQKLRKHFLRAQSDREMEPFFQEVSIFSGTQGLLSSDSSSGLYECEVPSSHFVESGVFVLPDVHTTVSDPAKVCWMMSDDWLSCVELGDKLVRCEHIQQGVQLLLQGYALMNTRNA